MTSGRRVCVVTGTRADYGLLQSTLRSIADEPGLQLQIIATGMHLSPEFGLTFRQIEADGFDIDARVEMLLSSDSATGVVKSVGLGVAGFADALERLRPDIVLVLGDRFEILAAAQAAMLMRIPLAHVHGGETTEGAFDESIRHAITKMAQWHFVSAELHRKRVIQMGEDPARVFNVGAPGLDQLARIRRLGRCELEAELGVSLPAPLFLVTYHPATLAERPPEALVDELLAALEAFPQATKIFTYPNADTGGRAIIKRIDDFVGRQPSSSHAFVSLGQLRYLSLMELADAVIGNSSSGLIEAPALRRATVNIGDRQKGRLRAASVIDAREDRDDIVRAIRLAVSADFGRIVERTVSPYGQGNAGEQIARTLKTLQIIDRKAFFDIHHDY